MGIKQSQSAREMFFCIPLLIFSVSKYKRIIYKLILKSKRVNREDIKLFQKLFKNLEY